VTASPAACWSNDRVEIVRALWNDGWSAGQIAVMLGPPYVTRNSVIGIVYRRKLSTRAPAAKPTHFISYERRKSGPKPKMPARGAVAITKLRPLQPLAPVPSPTIDYSFARPWEERGPRQCAFPIGSGEDVLSCCAPTEEGQSYCEPCRAVMTNPVQPTKRNTMRLARLAA